MQCDEILPLRNALQPLREYLWLGIVASGFLPPQTDSLANGYNYNVCMHVCNLIFCTPLPCPPRCFG